MNKEYFWSYIAGFFDGEGCIYVNKENRIRIEISQKRTFVLEEIMKFLNTEGITSIISYSKNDKASELRINKHREIMDFLEKILPYTIVKKQETENAIKIMTASSVTRGCIKLSDKRKVNDLWKIGFNASQISLKTNLPLRTIKWLCYRSQSAGKKIRNLELVNQ